MKILRRSRRVADLHVVLGAELEVAFKPRRRVFGPLTLEAVRQKKDEARGLLPLVNAGRDECIKDDLRAVCEVAELRLPRDERVARDDRVAVLEADHALLRERTVEDLDERAPVTRRHLTQRCPRLPCLRVVEYGVALTERAAPGILSAQANSHAFQSERAEGRQLCEGPVERGLTLAHLR